MANHYKYSQCFIVLQRMRLARMIEARTTIARDVTVNPISHFSSKTIFGNFRWLPLFFLNNREFRPSLTFPRTAFGRP